MMKWKMRFVTYIRGFFLGPGFPLGLGKPSGVRLLAALLVPGFGPGIPLFFGAAAGGASEFGLDGVSVPLAEGTALGSAGVSEGDGSTTWAAAAVVLLADEDGGDELA